MSCVLGIYDSEPAYANLLVDFIKRKQKLLTQVRVFTNQDSLKNYVDHNQIHILLLSESISVEEVIHENIKKICLLSEGNYIRENIGYPVIYKFQSAELVMQEIFSYYPLEDHIQNPVLSSGNRVKLVSVYSIARESEQMVLSLTLARQYARKKKTLYINLDVYQVLPESSEQNSEKSLSEFIYFLKQNHPNLISKMNGIIKKMEKLDYIQGVIFGPDLYELTAQDMESWIKELMKCSGYEVIVFNVGSFFEATLELFRKSSELLILLGEHGLDQDKYNNFRGQLLWAGFEDILQKIKVISLSKEMQNRYLSFSSADLFNETSNDLIEGYLEE